MIAHKSLDRSNEKYTRRDRERENMFKYLGEEQDKGLCLFSVQHTFMYVTKVFPFFRPIICMLRVSLALIIIFFF